MYVQKKDATSNVQYLVFKRMRILEIEFIKKNICSLKFAHTIPDF